MVRAGVVKDPAIWSESGYAEIRNGRQRYQLVDRRTLAALLELSTLGDVRLARQSWIKASIEQKMLTRDTCWTEWLAVGSAEFVEEIKGGLGIRGRHRDVRNAGRECILRENEFRWGSLQSKSGL